MLSHDFPSSSNPQPPHLLRSHAHAFPTATTQLPTPKSSKPSSPSRSPHRYPSPVMTITSENAEHIWIVTGPAGCGKTTVAKFLAWNLSLPYIEGDDHHPQSNKDKMSKGIPLTDADRWDWLITLRELAVDKLTTPTSEISGHGPNNNRGVIITCSALKHKYRDVIRVAAYNHPEIQIHFIYLKADETLLQQRVAARQGHFMKSGMVHSQFENLEEPDHEGDVLIVDVDAAPEVVQEKALDIVKAKLKEYEPEETTDSEQATPEGRQDS